ncbi:MAG: hypothetical protein J0J05_05085 [Microbacterium sp.]|uniref:hypothetical protein n=1 Tax=Microbacterium sp. TaxID=51671 RepID=UPI001AC4E7C3|nr:hypothetical protein [Microbacterium sp.]MBN9153339.1 hypothetical protein [Microbacterium sp.]
MTKRCADHLQKGENNRDLKVHRVPLQSASLHRRSKSTQRAQSEPGELAQLLSRDEVTTGLGFEDLLLLEPDPPRFSGIGLVAR